MTLFRPQGGEQRAISRDDFLRGVEVNVGATKSGQSVTFESAMALDAVAAVVGLFSDVVFMLPVDTFRQSRGDVPVEIGSPSLVASPSLTMSARDWRVQAMVSWLMWGNAYGLILTRTAMGHPATVEWLDPATVDVTERGVGRPLEFTVAGSQVDADRILHVPGRWLRPGSQLGIAPLERFRETFGLAQAARDYGAQWFGEGGHPTGVLYTDQAVSQDQAKTIKDRFVAAVRGRREPVVLGANLRFEQMQSSPKDSELNGSQDRAVVAVARAYGVQPEMVAASMSGSSVTYANREQRALDFLTFSADPWLVRFEDLWFRHMPRPEFAKFNRGALLRTDIRTRFDVHALAIGSGMASPNERRRLEDLPPYEGGDEFVTVTSSTTTSGGVTDGDE